MATHKYVLDESILKQLQQSSRDQLEQQLKYAKHKYHGAKIGAYDDNINCHVKQCTPTYINAIIDELRARGFRPGTLDQEKTADAKEDVKDQEILDDFKLMKRNMQIASIQQLYKQLRRCHSRIMDANNECTNTESVSIVNREQERIQHIHCELANRGHDPYILYHGGKLRSERDINNDISDGIFPDEMKYDTSKVILSNDEFNAMRDRITDAIVADDERSEVTNLVDIVDAIISSYDDGEALSNSGVPQWKIDEGIEHLEENLWFELRDPIVKLFGVENHDHEFINKIGQMINIYCGCMKDLDRIEREDKERENISNNLDNEIEKSMEDDINNYDLSGDIDYGLGISDTPDTPDTPPINPDKERSFRKELGALLNNFSIENGSNTPDYILANYVADSIFAFDAATQARTEWYGCDSDKRTTSCGDKK